MKFNKVTSFEHACQILGQDPTKLPEVSHLEERDALYQLTVFKMTKIIQAINNGWKVDRSDVNQRKWFPVFIGSGAGFVFNFSYCVNSFSFVGARLELCSEEAVEYAASQFLSEYNIIING